MDFRSILGPKEHSQLLLCIKTISLLVLMSQMKRGRDMFLIIKDIILAIMPMGG